ncbi:MAG: FtsX-like permease family protein [Luteitalea sp.]|nr:FtsX-like permease family protein [Luteitalea sp.]
MDALVRDVRQALRLLAGNRGFAAAALVTIALGVGGTAAVFSVVYGVLLRPLPYPAPERLVRLWEVHPGARAPIPGERLSHLTYHAWSRSSESLQDIAAFHGADYTVTGLGDTQRFRGTRVTPSLFRVLRVSPALGRFFSEDDAREGAAPVVVLGHAMWRERFGRDPAVLGRTLTIDDEDHRIIGIAPPGFAFPQREVGLRDDRREITFYTPLAVPKVEPEANTIHVVGAIGRLKAGVTMAQAEAEGTAYARSVERPWVADMQFSKGGPVEARVRSIVDQMTMSVRPALLVLAAAIGLVLLIACANVANLFLSRNSDRARELAVRAALGAERARLIRQLLTESLVISLIGGVVGMFLGWALTATVPLLAPADFPRLEEVHVDLWFLTVAALAAVFVGVVSGATPAFRSSRVDLSASMQAGGARSVGTPGARMRRALLVIEAALAVVLLVGAALLARSFVELVQTDAGYDSANVLTADLHLSEAANTREDAEEEQDARMSQLTISTLERLRAIPSVRAAGAGTMAPFGGAISSSGFDLPGMTTADGKGVRAQAHHAVITPGYAEALGMRLTEGRFIRDQDMTSPICAMLVNETFAKTYFTDGKPVTGRRFVGMFPKWFGRDDAVVEVVGVVEDVSPAAVDAPPYPHIYTAYGDGMNIGGTIIVKAERDPASIAPLLRGVVRQLEPNATLNRLGPLAAKMSASVGEPRFAMFVLVAFAVLALALASVGLYGVLSYNVAQRRREIGVRAALGATRGDLIRMVLREGLTVTVLGLLVGIAVAAFATRAMASILFGVAPLDQVAFSLGALLLLGVACAACLIPARRAAGIDPAEALRAE